MTRDPMPDAQDSTTSSLREKLLEHLFVADLLRHLWCQGARDVEVLRSEVDRGGYDLVFDANGVMRHVQLKSSHRIAKTREVNVNVNLARRPSGCIVWLQFDPASMELGPFLWFGAPPGEPLPPLGDRIGRHTKADSTGHKSERQGIRRLRRQEFRSLPSIGDVAVCLFGPIAGATANQE